MRIGSPAARPAIAGPFARDENAVAQPRRGKQRFDPLRWFDMVWTATAMGAMLLIYALGSHAVIVIIAMLPIYVAARYRTAPRVLLAITPILLLPSLVMLSTLWSIAPSTTSYYGFQYFVTVAVGATIGAGTDRRQALYGLFIAFAGYAVASLLFGRTVDWGGGGASRITSAFAGLTGSKNAAADSAAIGLLVSGAMLAAMLRERRPVLALSAGGIIVIELWVLRSAESTGALVACACAAMAMIGWNIARPLAPATRTAVFIAIGSIVAIAAALQKLWLQPLVAALLAAAGKDATLTGRTYIWDRAYRLIEARPGFGVGYGAFWRRDNLDALGIWQYAGVGPQGPFSFNFHNTFIEILVHLGYVGLALYGIVALSMFAILIVRTMRAPSDMGILFAAYLSYAAVRLSIETLAFGPFTYSTAMLMTGLGCAVWNKRQIYSPALPRRAGQRKAAWRSV